MARRPKGTETIFADVPALKKRALEALAKKLKIHQRVLLERMLDTGPYGDLLHREMAALELERGDSKATA